MNEPQLHDEISAYMACQSQLLKQAGEPWVVFNGSKLRGRFNSFQDAYEFASENFEPGHYLIRDIHESDPFAPLFAVNE